MPVVSRLVTAIALGCVLASSLIDQVSAGRSGAATASALKARHHHQHNKKAHHQQGAADALKKRDPATKAKRCPAKTITSQASGPTGGSSSSSSSSSGKPTASASDVAFVRKPAPTPTTSKYYTSGSTSTAGNSSPSSAPAAGGGNPPQVPSGSYKSKVGLSWTDSSLPQKNFAPHASWCYNWGCSESCAEEGSGLQYAPMFWGTKDIENWKNNVMPHKDWWMLLGFNEPNIAGQSNMSPGDAAGIWKQYINPVTSEHKCSPAVTTGSQGLDWLKSFNQACGSQDGSDAPDCPYDIVCIHHYDLTTESFTAQAQDFYKAFNKPIWVTEIGCQSYSGGGDCTMDMALAMMRGVVAFVQDTDWITGFAWYQMAQSTNIAQANILITGNDEPTQMAQIFMGIAN